jgi:Kef-type K+ transport system membrane component KefB
MQTTIMDKKRKMGTLLLAIMIFMEVLGFILGTYSIARNVTLPSGNPAIELSYPYQIEGAVAIASGIAILLLFGNRYIAPRKNLAQPKS